MGLFLWPSGFTIYMSTQQLQRYLPYSLTLQQTYSDQYTYLNTSHTIHVERPTSPFTCSFISFTWIRYYYSVLNVKEMIRKDRCSMCCWPASRRNIPSVSVLQLDLISRSLIPVTRNTKWAWNLQVPLRWNKDSRVFNVNWWAWHPIELTSDGYHIY